MNKILLLLLLCSRLPEVLSQSGRPDVLLPFGHTAEITCMDISSDSRWIVSAANKTILIWDVRTGIPVKKIEWSDYVLKLYFFQNDKQLIVASSSAVNSSLGATHYDIYDFKNNVIVQKGPFFGSENVEMTNDKHNILFQVCKANSMMPGSFYYTKEDELVMWNLEQGKFGGAYYFPGGYYPKFNFYPLNDPAYFVTITNQHGQNNIHDESDTSYNLHIWHLQKSVYNVNLSNPNYGHDVPKPLGSVSIGAGIHAVSSSKFDPYFATASGSGIQVWHYESEKSTGIPKFSAVILNSHVEGQVQSMEFSARKTLLVYSITGTGNLISIVDLQSRQVTAGIKLPNLTKDFLVRFSPNGEYIVTKDSTDLMLYDNKGFLVRKMDKKVTNLSVGKFTADDRKVITYHNLYMLASYKKMMDSLDYTSWFLTAKATDKNVTYASSKVKDSLFQLYTANLIRTDYKKIERSNVRVWDLSNGFVLNYLPDSIQSKDTISNDQRHILLGDYFSTGYKKTFSAAVHVMRDSSNALYNRYGKEMDAIDELSNTLSAQIPLIDNDKSFVNRGYGPSLKLVNRLSKDTVMLISIDTTDWIMLCRDGYYMSSFDATKSLGYMFNNNVYLFAQFDVQFNRPDVVLERIGIASKETIEAYRKAYEKRLKLMGLTSDNFNKSLSLNAPSINIKTNESFTFQSKSRHFTVQVNASDQLYRLDRLNFYINGVPYFGSKGRNLKSRNTKIISDTLGFELSNGRNDIEISVLNEKGIASITERLQVEYTGTQRKPDLYIVTIGAGKYSNPKYNLTYASKDANDVAALFATNTRYGKIIPVVLINEQVTRSAVQGIKKILLSSKVDDQVLIFYAGHGVINSAMDYYLGTYNMNFEQPQNAGLPYEDLEGLLQDIPARQKLLLIDACHSGEIDNEEASLVKKQKGPGNITFRNAGDLNVAYKRTGLENSFQMMKELFMDLRRSTGATVISSASGVESAFEGDVWKNGVFTYCLLSGIKEQKADLNLDGRISASELHRYIQGRVSELTQGQQTPTSRIENFITDFIVW